MTLDEFTLTLETLREEGDDKAATLLAQEESELYARYWVEVYGGDPEDLI